MLNKFDKNKIFVLINVIFIVTMVIMHLFSYGENVNFYPINGAFQNFNPVRHFFDNETQYVDYYDYLGFGHLYIGSFFTFIFGKTFQSSIIAFNAIHFISFIFILFIISTQIDKKNYLEYVSLVLIALMIFEILPNMNYSTNLFLRIYIRIRKAFIAVLSTGVSARFIRAMILPVVGFSIIIYVKYFLDKINKKKYKYILHSIAVGFLTSISFLYSNDFGISSFLSLNLIYFVLLIIYNKKIINNIFYIIISLISFSIFSLVFVSIFTKGNVIDYLNVIKNSSFYQRWYYNTTEKHYYLYDINFKYTASLHLAIIFYLIYRFFKNVNNRESILSNVVLIYLNLTSYAQMQMYYLVSGGFSFEVEIVVMMITLLYLMLKYALDRINNHKNIKIDKVFKCIVSVLCVIFTFVIIINDHKYIKLYLDRSKRENYIKALDGCSDDKYDDLMKAYEFTKDGKLFSTYTSALDVMKNIKQPSGIDYIIHVLSDSDREKYLKSFNNDDFKYVVTINPKEIIWEFWVERANWFFYRELYKKYHPVFNNKNWVYWEKNEGSVNYNDNINDYNISLKKINDDTAKIIINTNKKTNGIADVYVDYESSKTDSINNILLFNNMVKVANTHILVIDEYNIKYEDYIYGLEDFESNYLRPISKEYIPIRITDGYGEVTITSNPQKFTTLKINEVKLENVFTVTYDYEDMLYK